MEMKRTNLFTVLTVAGLMFGFTPIRAAAQTTPAAQPATDTPATEAHSWPLDQLVPLSVREAWHLSGKNEETFFEIVKQLAELSAQKRGITLPDTKEAGSKAGEWIKKEARKDPDQLLYVIVDHAVQYSARVGTSSTK
jgi:hypothetical protein